MKGSEAQLLGFMEGNDKRYVIPVYQRKYDWKIDNCRQLYEDLKRIIIDKRNSHFFGSIVSQVVPNGSKIEFHIIDGQQRLTTVTLLLLALSNLLRAKKIQTNTTELDDQIRERFIIDKWAKTENRIKLLPVKSDRNALEKLVNGDEESLDPVSNLTINYHFFCEQILKEEITADELYEAIGKLQIICITLDSDDKAQLIFESLNSTGLALTEGDKIRNYVLMGLSPQKQDAYYENYWTKIEQCAGSDVSPFVRDYLSIKQQITPTINNVYQAFKNYVEKERIPLDSLLDDMKKYARIYQRVVTGKSGLDCRQLDDCMYRLNRLEITVTEPFFMEAMRLHIDGEKLSVEDLTHIFQITESYLFRRNICDVSTSSLNKVFLTLNREIIRYDNTTDHYVDKMVYALLSKKESGRFPDDEEFSQALANKAVYLMRGKYKAYLFERFENYGTLETKDVYTLLDNGTYSIEHIMPQHLTPAWMQELGPDAEEIHSFWLHRLGNLTLTAYNSNMSNATFREKRDAELGYKNSGLRMNQRIAEKEQWGPEEMQERSDTMVNLATNKIWPMPETAFAPLKKEFESYSLDEEDIDLTGRDIVMYSYQNTETPVISWADMFEHVVKYLHAQDKSILPKLAFQWDQSSDFSNYFSSDPDLLRSPLKLDESIYVEKNTNTAMKLLLLRRLFVLFHADPMDLVFYLRDAQQDKNAEAHRSDLQRRYWLYALPIIQQENLKNDCFSKCSPIASGMVSGHFGIGGFRIICSVSKEGAKVDFYLGKSNKDENKAAFDFLSQHREEIEESLGETLAWNRADDRKASWISCSLTVVGISNESDWQRMAKFQAAWSKKLIDVILPVLKEAFVSDITSVERKETIYFYAKRWVLKKAEEGIIQEDIAHSNRTYTRFRTEEMSALLPEVDGLSGWGTRSHYYFEIQNRSGDAACIKLSFNSKNLTEEQKAVYDRMIACSNARSIEDGWTWRVILRSEYVRFEMPLSEKDIFAKLDTAWADMVRKKDEFIKKLNEQTGDSKSSMHA